MFWTIAFLLIGIVCLWFGSDFVVDGCKKIAKKYNISLVLVGLTIVSIGTSLPEIFTNIYSGIKTLYGIETSGVAVGTNIGSCLTQITLVLGIIALLGTLRATKKFIKTDGIMILVAIAIMFVFGLNGYISRLEGIILIVIYLIYLYVRSKYEYIGKEIKAEMAHEERKKIKVWNNAVLVVAGLLLLTFGSKLVVDNALHIAEAFGLAQSFIGVMIIGVGTALPELSTAIRGVLTGAAGISLGTLIGSNITDPLLSLGSGAVFTGFIVDKNLLFFDIPYWFFATIIALVLIRTRLRIGKEDRKEGLILLGLYAIFVFIKIKFFM